MARSCSARDALSIAGRGTREESVGPARRVDVKAGIVALLVLLALAGALVELARGRRPVLVARAA